MGTKEKSLKAKARAREDTFKAKTSNLHALVISSRGSLMQATIYKLLRTKAFGYFVNVCGNAINRVATIDAIELINLDFLDMDIKRSDYGYDEVVWKQCRWC